jgi:hypothetical protein
MLVAKDKKKTSKRWGERKKYNIVVKKSGEKGSKRNVVDYSPACHQVSFATAEILVI